MKRLFGLLSLALVLGAISMSHVVMAHNDNDAVRKVKVCHVAASRTLRNGRTTVIGTIEEIPVNTLISHLRHGDTIALTGEVGDCCAYCVTQAGLFCPPNID